VSHAQPSTPSLDGNFVSDAADVDPVHVNSSPLLQLLKHCLPVKSAEKTLGDLAEFWGEFTGCDWCTLVADEFCFPWEYSAKWSRSSGVSSVPLFSESTELNEQETDENPQHIRLATNDLGGESTVIESAVIPFIHDGTTSGWLNTSNPVSITSETQELLEASSRILATAVVWQREQTTSRLEAMAEFAAGAGHEVNNPLGTISGRVGQLLQTETDPQKRRSLELIGAQTYRIRDMISDTMTFARPPFGTPVDCDFSDAVNLVLANFAHEIQERNITILRRQSEAITIQIDETALRIIISETIKNAINAVDDGGTVAIETTLKTVNDTSMAHLRITNDGESLTEQELAHSLDPFYSGREAGRGLGFGLSKCWRIVHARGGDLHFHSAATGESVLDVLLPCEPADD